MRIVTGKLKGRYFNSPKGRRTHPMSEKMRGALFSTLGDIEGLTILDAFAGSGAISLEAISRGAKSAIAIDIDKDAHDSIVHSAKELSVGGKLKAIKANIYSWSLNNSNKQFDIVFCDPPYEKYDAARLAALEIHVKTGGLLVVSSPPSSNNLSSSKIKQLRRKNYGDSTATFYRKIKD